MITPKARERNIVVQELENETLVYDLETNRTYCLNKTSALVWQLCDGKHTISQVCDEMSKQLKNFVSEDIVWMALDQLSKDRLLENEDKLDFPVSGLSRREAIKRAGFASAVALPLISSLVAPEGAMAQSLAANGGACTPINNALCASNNCLNSGGGIGICCDAGSTQANAPGYSICSTDASAAIFAARCCSGNASAVLVGPACPNMGETRYICDPY